MTERTLVWLRGDLRLHDNPALLAASRRGVVIPTFIWSPEEEDPWSPGAASRWWLHHSLDALSSSLRAQGSTLVLRAGPSLEALRALIRDTGATAVYWSRRYEPAILARDARVEMELAADGIETATFNASLLFEPWEVATQAGGPYRVFTPFWNRCLSAPDLPPPGPTPRLERCAPEEWPASLALEALGLLPEFDWASDLRQAWTPGEAGAVDAFDRFVDASIETYDADRDRPDRRGTSRLSPHLHFGEISPRRIWHRLVQAGASGSRHRSEGRVSFMRQLGWREFAHHLLFHFPDSTHRPLRESFDAFPWAEDPEAFRSWTRGLTGYPLVDAGMSELWRTGWMHGRARMLAASFLVKDLMIPWQEGARWFWDTLVDADLANNTLGWQWTAGCGADAAPFFRIFNPISQGSRFDPDGAYVRSNLPALADVPTRSVHSPWMATQEVLARAGVKLGSDYPLPMIDHKEARETALEAYRGLSRGS